MSADPIIRVSCAACDTTVEVPFDTVGEMFAADFTERHAAHESPGSEQGRSPVTPETPTAGAETGPGAPNEPQTCNYPSVGPEPSGGRTASEEGQ